MMRYKLLLKAPFKALAAWWSVETTRLKMR